MDFFDVKADVEALLEFTGAREEFSFAPDVAVFTPAARPIKRAGRASAGSESCIRSWCARST